MTELFSADDGGTVPAVHDRRGETITPPPVSPVAETAPDGLSGDLRASLMDLLATVVTDWSALAKTNYPADSEYFEIVDQAAAALLAAGWRPPVPVTDRDTLVSVVGGIIDEHFGDDHDEASRVAAQAILDAGYLDKTGAVGPPEPVVTTLRRIIRDLDSEAVAIDGPVSKYAERLHQHPALAGAQILCTFCDEPIDHVLSLPGIARVHRLANGAMCPGSLTDKDGA